jgi:hypothetical protein
MESSTDTAVIAALRSATAVSLCLILAERFHIAQPGLAVWSTHMVMVQYAFTVFQKGVERALGRGCGILMALVLATLTRNAWGAGIVVELLLIVPLFYVYFSGRLSYTFLNAGLYLAAIMELARTHPNSVVEQGWSMFGAIALGVATAVFVTWVTGAEEEVGLRTEGMPLLPIDRDRLIHSLVLTLTVALVHIVSYVLELSTTTAIVSVLLLTITPDYQSLIHKGELRIAGAVLAIAFATVTLFLLFRVPSFPLLVVALFLGTYLAVLIARLSQQWNYAGVQMGLVLPMVLVVPAHEFGSFQGAFARIGGAILAILASIFVGVFWGAIAPTPPLPITASTTYADLASASAPPS